jgi:hypothetical protein
MMMRLVLMRGKGKQLTSIGKLVTTGQTAGEVRSTAEAVDLQQLNVDGQNWHMRSYWWRQATVPNKRGAGREEK